MYISLLSSVTGRSPLPSISSISDIFPSRSLDTVKFNPQGSTSVVRTVFHDLYSCIMLLILACRRRRCLRSRWACRLTVSESYDPNRHQWVFFPAKLSPKSIPEFRTAVQHTTCPVPSSTLFCKCIIMSLPSRGSQFSH